MLRCILVLQDITRLQDIARPSSQHFLRGKAGTGKVSPGAPVGQMNNNSDDNDSANGTMRQLTNMPEYWVPGLPSQQLSGLVRHSLHFASVNLHLRVRKGTT